MPGIPESAGGPAPATEAVSRMRKHVPLIWTFIGSFLIFATSLPLSHICLEPGLAQASAGNLAGTRASSEPAGPRLREHTPPVEDGICPACLWSQNLLCTDSGPAPAVARSFTVVSSPVAVPAVPHSDFFQSALKRGPPLARTAN